MNDLSLSQKLLSVQKKIGAVSKSSFNPHFKSKFADLNEVLDVAKDALNQEGIFIAQSPGADTYGKYLETSLIDGTSGQQISGRVYFSGNEDNMQKIGAAITYSRRFGLVSLLALESEDDDGEAAVGRETSRQNQVRVQGPNQAPKERTVSVNTQPAPGSSIPNVRGVSAEPKKTFPKRTSPRDLLLEKITKTSEILMAMGKATLEEMLGMVESYGVKSKEEMTDEQATELLSKLESKLNA